MTNLRNLRRRLSGVSAAGDITRAMEVVAASRLQGLQKQYRTFNPYNETWDEIVSVLFSPFPPACPEEGILPAVIAVGSDRGLVGSYNAMLLKTLRAGFDMKDCLVVAVGKRLIQSFNRAEYIPAAQFSDLPRPPGLKETAVIADYAAGLWRLGRAGEIYICAFTPELATPGVKKVLPLEVEETKTRYHRKEIIFEPEQVQLRDQVLDFYLRARVHGALLAAFTAEEATRVRAMSEAADNASDLYTGLTREYNRQRQAEITRELLDVAGGTAALEEGSRL